MYTHTTVFIVCIHRYVMSQSILVCIDKWIRYQFFCRNRKVVICECTGDEGGDVNSYETLICYPLDFVTCSCLLHIVCIANRHVNRGFIRYKHLIFILTHSNIFNNDLIRYYIIYDVYQISFLKCCGNFVYKKERNFQHIWIICNNCVLRKDISNQNICAHVLKEQMNWF